MDRHLRLGEYGNDISNRKEGGKMTNKEKYAEAKKKQRAERAAQGLCTKCGSPIDTDGHWCAKCRKDAREARAMFLSHGICPVCQKEKLFGQEKVCVECRAKKNELSAKYEARKKAEDGEAHRRRRNDNWMRMYYRRKEEGVCTACGKRKPEEGKAKCGICLNKNKEGSRAWRAHMDGGIPRVERTSYGLCYVCGNPLDGEWKLCARCRKRMIAVMSQHNVQEKGRAASPWNNELIFNRRLRRYCQTGEKEGADL